MAALETIAQVATGGFISAGTAYVVARRNARTSTQIEGMRQDHELRRDALRDEAAAANEAAEIRGHARLLQRGLTSTAMSFATCVMNGEWWPETSPFGGEPLSAELRPLASALTADEWMRVETALRMIQTMLGWRDSAGANRELPDAAKDFLTSSVSIIHRAVQVLDRLAEATTPENDYGLATQGPTSRGQSEAPRE